MAASRQRRISTRRLALPGWAGKYWAGKYWAGSHWAWTALLVSLGGCGGGGGEEPPVLGVAGQIGASATSIPAGSSRTELTVALITRSRPDAVLLEARVELPPQLTLTTGPEQLVALTPLQTLRGNFADGAFRILCGDTVNPSTQAQPLPTTELFRIGLTATSPRTPGTYTVRLSDLRMASAAGEDAKVAQATLDIEIEIL
ncbi:MAG: hypothetical protein AB8H80_22075 [Planctomycetota bacterium]